MAKDILNVGGFTILGRLGKGARTTIYRATDDEDGQVVALKRVLLQRPEDARVLEQTETEYNIATKIDHPYIRKCFKIKRIKSLFRVRELVMSMELFEGQTLEECTGLSLGDVLLIFRMVAAGLSAVHQKGFVHCDIKPNNILVNKAGVIKIIDLGQGCPIGTTKSRIQGTPDYIAPEQVKREPLGPRTDIFNLGATMYWALTGKNVPTLIPAAKNGVGLLEKRGCQAPHELKPLIPRSISGLVMGCVQDNPTDRPKDMNEIVLTLDGMIHEIFGDRIKAKRNGTAGN